jgi:hypothetical protein
MANARCQWNLIWALQEVLISPRLKTTTTPQIVTSGVRILLHYALRKTEQNHSQRACPRPHLAAGQVQQALEKHKRADQHADVSPHPSDPAAGTKTAKSKKKRKKNRENGGKGSELNNWYELDI